MFAFCRPFIFLVQFCALMVYLGWPAQAQPPLTIAIIQPYDISAYNEAVEGFLAALKEEFNRDFNPVIYDTPQRFYAALTNEKTGSPTARIDLILTVGTEATAAVAQKITEIPMVFTMVLDPARILAQRPDIVGASLNISLELQLNMIKEVLPAVEKIGIIYDPAQNAEVVAQSTALAEKFGLQIKPLPVTSQKELPKALEQVNDEAEALWGIVDNTVYTSQTAKFMIRETVARRLPFIGLSASYVRAGALCALVFDNREIGRQAAQLANQILAGAPAAELRATTPEKISLALNLRTAELIGVTIPAEIRAKAAIVYE